LWPLKINAADWKTGSHMINFDVARQNMVENQLRPNGITDERVLTAMGCVARECFIQPSHQGIAYVDEDISLGQGRYLMEPMVMARLLQAANIGPDDVILDIGCGSGYTAAVCANLGATVVALECDPTLGANATRIMEEKEIDNVVVIESPLNEGFAAQAPYDVIIFSGAVPEIPPAILNQLSDGGRLAAIVSKSQGLGHGTLAQNENGTIGQRVLFDSALPLLPDFEPKPSFVF
jgi:protein-L-isoaspartate(D-aspartate) O-methyltransferase